ncbi:Dehydrogenase with different specificities [marine gamma proteobacterium HTCC2143]|jgi:3-oxoacyl-[acyl-carrier protein] reductase|uniref:Dehydrogenase with different specificities n=1 Tax=marine gamma proteobacterium HTCC2143 TaxID=247633 RepID=A0YD28_9GAMM|nr:Dehydrogenase with different specificities [marine gamma proteobacterium HTCC2143]
MAKEKVWLVTGASRGIGLEVARRVINAGERVALLARGESVLEAAKELGENALGLQADVSDPASVQAATEKVVARWGRIDTVVNNAGMHRGGKVGRLALEDWQAVINTNLTGALNVISAARPNLKEGSSIVNIGAVVGFRGFPGDAAYGASKAGLAGLTRALAIELAGKGITVNLVIPGLVLTDMTGGLSDKALESMRKTVPMGRYGEPEEIAEVIEWVARSRYMTGAFVPVDGGLMSSFGVPQ